MTAQHLTARNLTPLLLGLTLNPINSSIIATALVPIGNAFHATAAETAWLIAALYLATSVGQPLMGRFADVYGAIPVFYAGLMLTMLAGIGGAIAPSLSVLIAWRVVLGLGTSAAYPAAMILLRRFAADSAGRLRPGALSAVTVAGQVSIVVGPTLGGLLVQYGGWRATVVAVVPVALCAGIVGAFWLPRGTTPRGVRQTVRQIDVPGIVAFAAGLTLLLVTLMHPRSVSPYVTAACVACFVLWYFIERRSAVPFIDVRMLASNRSLIAIYARYVGIYTIFYSVFYGFPQWLEQAHHATPAQAGLLMLPTSLVAIACALAGARLAPRTALLVGCTGAFAGCLFLLFALHAQSSAYAVLVASAVLGIPNGMNPVSEQATLALHAPPAEMGVASGLLRTAGYVGAMLASSLIAITFGGGIEGDRPLHLLAIVLVAIAAVLVLVSGMRVAKAHFAVSG